MAVVRRIEQAGVMGFLHEPTGQTVAGLALTHGIGGNCRETRLVGMANALCEEGVLVVRCDLASSLSGHAGPTSPAVKAADRETLQAALEQLGSMVSTPILLGGNSYGAR